MSGAGSAALNRSCEACRTRKVKCIVACTSDAQTCERCLKQSLDCTFLPPIKRKKRRRNEGRIRELEEKLQAIQGTVMENFLLSGDATQRTPDQVNYAPNLEAIPPKLVSVCVRQDPVSCGMIAEDIAQILFDKFRLDMAPIYPIVSICAHEDYQSIMVNEPALFSAILSAASSPLDTYLFKTMFNHAASVLANAVIVQGLKSLKLIQALLIMATWHHPTERFDELKFSQYAHMAATMVEDLRSLNDTRYAVPELESGEYCACIAETCRTFVACYFLCSSISVTLRRRNQLDHGQWLEDSLTYLAKWADMNDSDKQLIEFVKLQRIAEDGVTKSCLNPKQGVACSDPNANPSLSGPVERAIRWWQALPGSLATAPIQIHYNVVICQLALHEEADITDTRPPYKLRLNNESSENKIFEISPALEHCILSSNAILHTFLSLSIDTLRSVPVIIYARMAFAVIVLVRIDLMTKKHLSPDYLFLQDTLASTKTLLHDLVGKLQSVTGVSKFQVPATFQVILIRIIDWYTGIDRAATSCGEMDELFEPMRLLNVDDSKQPLCYAVEDPVSTGYAGSHEGIFEVAPENLDGQLSSIASTEDIFEDMQLNYMAAFCESSVGFDG